MAGRGLSKEEVATTALQILDDVGLADFTMRRLASALGVQPSAIYWHYPNKQTLLAALADRILTERDAGEPDAAWPRRARDEAFRLREALLTYRDGAEIVASTIALGLGSGLATARLVGSLAHSPFSPDIAERAAETMLHFVLGYVSLEQQRLSYDSAGARDGEASMLQDSHDRDRFGFGVDTIISGLQVTADRAVVPGGAA